MSATSKTTWTKTVTVEREGGVVTRTTTTVTLNGAPASEAEMDAATAEMDREFAHMGEDLAALFRRMADFWASAFKRRP